MAELDPAGEASCVLEVSDDHGTPVIRLSGELDLVTVESVRAAMEAVLTRATERLVFEVGELEFMDSSGIALLVSASRLAEKVELRNPTLIVRRLIELTGLSEKLIMVP
jgi:anti-sigma B factor antagonist